MRLKATIKNAISHLNQQQKKQLLRWFGVSMLGSLLKAFGVVSIMPFVALITEPSLVQSNSAFAFLYQLFGSHNYNEFLLSIGLGTITIFVIASSYSIFEVWYGLRVFNQLEKELSIRLFKGYANQPYQFFLHQKQSETVRRVTQEVEIGIVDVVITTVEIISSTFLTIILIGFLTYANPWVAFISACGLFIAHLWVEYYVGNKIVQIGRNFTRLNDTILNTSSEMFSGIKEVKIAAAESRFVKKYAETYEGLSTYSTRYGVLEHTPREILETLAYISIVLFSIFAIIFYQKPETVFPLIAMYALASYRLIPALREIFTGIEKIHLSEYSLSKLSADFDTIKQNQKKQSNLKSVAFKQLIELRDICFHYEGSEETIFDHYNTSIKASKLTLLSGPSGVGKTTLADILMGLLKPTSGSIIVDGVVLKTEHWKHWQASIGYVPQSVYLFQGSIMQNVAIAEQEDAIDRQRVKKCCQIAQIDDYIETLKQGYESILGQGNQILSGGQLKRLGIARALYKQPALLILDESTNEIEALKKIQVIAALKAIPDLSVLIISHDKEIALHCDETIELN